VSTTTGKPWIKIRNSQDGSVCEILSVRKTDYTDPRGNVSYSIDFRVLPRLSLANQTPDQQTSLTPAGSTSPSQITKNDYWERREQRDREWQAEQIRNKPRIERQHSQEMALRWFLLIVSSNEGVAVIPTTEKLREMINWFQRDIDRSPEKTIPQEPPHDGEAYQDQEDSF
jgi:hypothetical protein